MADPLPGVQRQRLGRIAAHRRDRPKVDRRAAGVQNFASGRHASSTPPAFICWDEAFGRRRD